MWWGILKHAVKDFVAKEEVFVSGTLAFYALLAFFPFMIFLTSLAGFYGDALNVQQGIDYLIQNTPREVREVVMPVVEEVTQIKEGGLVTVGFLGTLWILMSGVDALRLGLNRAYCIHEKRTYIARKIQSISFVFFISFAVVILSVAIILGPILLQLLYHFLPLAEQLAWLWNLSRYVFGFFIMAGLMSSIYYFLPNVRQYWRRVLPGAFVATLLWMLLASLFSVYLAYASNYSVTYGSLSGVVIAMVFLKASAILFLFGAEVNYAY